MKQDVPAPLVTGTRIGPYEIIEWLGAGGMGVVYRARDPRLDRAVAIKVISPACATDTGRIARFQQEARAAEQLNHPNVLTVYDIGLHEGTPYIVSELLEGETLRTRLQAGRLPPQKVVDYARQIAAGLAAAHDRHLVHRDVKPENLFITSDERIKILDFGLVKLTGSDGDASTSGSATDTHDGAAAGTTAYMSPEQVRGEMVDARSDIFSGGAVLHEMLTGRAAFARATGAETMVAVLNEDPQPSIPPDVSPGVARIVSRCLEKAREARLQSARDLAFALEVVSDTHAPLQRAPIGPRPRPVRLVIAAMTLLVLFTAGAVWLARGRTPPPPENVLANATFSRVTDWAGTESGAEISPDGRFVAFVADRDGELNLFQTQVGTGRFMNLTSGLPALSAPNAILRTLGFSGDGADIWITAAGDAGAPKSFIPVSGGAPRPFLGASRTAPSWSPDGTRLAFFTNGDGDPLYVADRTGADAQRVIVDDEQFYARGAHNHNPVWSPDGMWLYFAHGSEPTEDMNVWRVRPSGGTPERLTSLHVAINFLAPIDDHTVLFIAHAENGSGPWLWSLDVDSKAVRRVTSGLEHYSSVSASRDGRRVVVTLANPTATLWSVPLLDRIAQDRDVQRYAQANPRAFAPRFGGDNALFYLSDRGAGDGLWKQRGGQSTEVWKAPDDSLTEPPAVSPDGGHVAVVARRDGKRQLVVMTADGTDARTLAPSIVVRGSGGQGSADWSPDGAWIVVAAEGDGAGLFKVPVNGGPPVRLVSGEAMNPVWSPDGTLIVYGGPTVSGQVPLRAVRPDGTTVTLPKVLVRLGGAHRFLRDGSGLVFLAHGSVDFRLLDLKTNATRLLTHLSDQGAMHTFDITPDGASIVFERSRANSDIYLIDLPGR